MQTMHPTLLIGPADWNPNVIPRAEFDERLAALWRDHGKAVGAIVYGDPRNHAALAYLTNFTPKLEPALALIPRAGAPRMLIGGGVNMLPAAKPLTFIESAAPLRDVTKTVTAWTGTLPAGGSIVFIGGDAMPYDLRKSLDDALGAAIAIEKGDNAIHARMRVKSRRELNLIRGACTMLDAAVAALRDAARIGKGVTDCILLAEHAALQCGAQDVRSLFSLDRGRTLRPFEVPISQACDPLQVYLAVQNGGYWAEAFVRVSALDDALQAKAESLLRAMITAAKAGLSCRSLTPGDAVEGGTLRLHPLADEVVGTGIGMSLDESPILARSGGTTLEEGAVYSLRAGVLDNDGTGAIVSALVALTGQGSEVIWPIGEGL
jgi:Xaa-Pro aminopeptidase